MLLPGIQKGVWNAQHSGFKIIRRHFDSFFFFFFFFFFFVGGGGGGGVGGGGDGAREKAKKTHVSSTCSLLNLRERKW